MYIRQTKARTVAIVGARPILGCVERNGSDVTVVLEDTHLLEALMMQDPLMSMEMVYEEYWSVVEPDECEHNASAIIDHVHTPSDSEAYIDFNADQALARNNKSPPKRQREYII
jgi:hypothetical protein